MNGNYSFTDYEDAILAALAELKKENGGYLLALEGYGGQLDSEAALKVWAGRFPAVAVAVPQAEYPDTDRSNVYGGENVSIYMWAGAHSWRGQGEARKGVVGVHKIIMDIRRLIFNKTLGLAIRPCLPKRVTIFASTQTMVIYQLEYQIINDRITEE